jgi:hypothetical protein
MKKVLQVRAKGREPMVMESYSADEVVVVEATEAERQELTDRGFTDVQYEA